VQPCWPYQSITDSHGSASIAGTLTGRVFGVNGRPNCFQIELTEAGDWF
jgi:hypothetical protein